MKQRITSKVRFMRGASVTVLSLATMMGTTPAAWTAGNITNTPTVNGTVGGTPITPVTGTQVDVPIEDKTPSMVVLKTDTFNDLGAVGPSVGDTVTYTITVENDGNVTLDNVVLTDTLVNGDSTALSYDASPILTGGDVGVVGDLEVGETWTYTATYTITQDDIDSGSLDNRLSVSALDPQSVPVTEDADDPGDTTDVDTDTDGDPEDPTVTTFAQTATLVALKSDTLIDGGDGVANATTDSVSYSITVQNTGNVTLTGVALTDTLLDGGSNALTLTSGPTFSSASSGSAEGTLLPGETATYTASFTLTQAAIESGSVSNSVSVTANGPSGQTPSDTSDDPTDPTLTGADDPTVTPLPAVPALLIAKTFVANNGTPVGAGDQVTYTYTVTNTGNVIVDDITISDNHQGNTLLSTAGPDSNTVPYDEAGALANVNSTDAGVNGSFDALWPGEVVTFTYVYTVTQADVDNQ